MRWRRGLLRFDASAIGAAALTRAEALAAKFPKDATAQQRVAYAHALRARSREDELVAMRDYTRCLALDPKKDACAKPLRDLRADYEKPFCTAPDLDPRLGVFAAYAEKRADATRTIGPDLFVGSAPVVAAASFTWAHETEAPGTNGGGAVALVLSEPARKSLVAAIDSLRPRAIALMLGDVLLARGPARAQAWGPADAMPSEPKTMTAPVGIGRVCVATKKMAVPGDVANP